MNPLDRIPLDTSHHAIGGSIVSTVGACAAILMKHPELAWQVAAAAGLAAGVLNEAVQAVINKRATGKWMGEPKGTPHSIEVSDIAATALGGVLVALPLLVQTI